MDLPSVLRRIHVTQAKWLLLARSWWGGSGVLRAIRARSAAQPLRRTPTWTLAAITQRAETTVVEANRVVHASLMTTLKIHDADPASHSAFGLKDILALLRPRSDNAEWEIDHADEEFWATGEDIRGIEALAGSGQRVSGEALSSLVDGLHQVIWGEFKAFDGSATNPWVIVRAIDSSNFEIETDDDVVVDLVRRHFNNVQSAG
jgi:hypothetical protein